MKTSEVLFLAIGGLEASRLEQTEAAPLKHPRPRAFLFAAVIALMLLLVGCAVAVYSRIHLNYRQHEVPTATTAPVEAQPAKNVLTDCYPQQLPAGYTLTGGSPVDRNTQSLRYRDLAGKYISYHISTRNTYEELLHSSEDVSHMTIGGLEATMQTMEGGDRALFWRNEAEGYYAWLFTNDDAVDLAAMAESVSDGERLPLFFVCKDGAPWDIWYPQLVPNGYSISQVTIQDLVQIKYSGEKGSIQYYASFVDNFLETMTDPPHDSFVWTDETVNGQSARLLTTSGGLRLLFWDNAQEGFHAMLHVQDDDSVDILAMAESVAAGDALEADKDYLGPDFSIELSQDQDGYYGWESIYPQAVPEGYTVTFVSDRAYGEQTIRYENSRGALLTYTFYYRLGEYGRDFGGTGQPQQVDINGNVGYLGGNSLLWTDDAKGYAFSLYAEESLDLVSIAKSVGLGPELEPSNHDKLEKALEQLGDYQPAALPEGMVLDEMTGYPLEDGGAWYSYIRRWYVDKKTNAQIFFTYESYVSDVSSVERILRGRFGSEANPVYQTVNGCPGAAAQDGKKARVVWIQGSAEKGTIYEVMSQNYTVEELLKISQSVEKQ